MTLNKGRIFASFSGGRSSALMCKIILESYKQAEKVFIFANTGEEHEKTLEYVDQVDRYLGLGLVWVEAVINPAMNEGTTHKVVDFKTAARNGEPFEAMIRKYGITNKAYPHCTRETKTNAMYSYLGSIGWKIKTYSVALGIRADEPARFDSAANEKGIFYPLAEAGLDKRDVIDEVRRWPFDLGIEEREGNCKWCWKKSDAKHIVNIQKNPEWYEFPKRMEKNYSAIRSDLDPRPRYFFRNHRSTDRMFALAKAVGEQMDLSFLPKEEDNSPCSEECGIAGTL